MLLQWLKALPWIVAVRESAWQYPIIETLHGIGMGLLVGTLTVMDLRLLGRLERLPISALLQLRSLIWIGFVINACTGVVMFMTDGPRLVTNWIFGVKIALIVLGVAAALRLQRLTAARAAGWSAGGAISADVRWLAIASLVIWYGAIVAGRVTAFLGDQ